jgi:serine/threonine protein kinase
MWLYKNEVINSIGEMPDGTYGFIYQVTHLPSNRKYIGKKVLYFERNVKLGKKELEILKEERKSKGIRGRAPAKKKVIKESDWKTYYGSQTEIKELVKDGKESDFKREILKFVDNKKHLTYFECKYLFIYEVLENNNEYINDNILAKFYSRDF